jgi:hypothetical protein
LASGKVVRPSWSDGVWGLQVTNGDEFQVDDIDKAELQAALQRAIASGTPLGDEVRELITGPMMQGRPDAQRIEELTAVLRPLYERVWREFGPE